VKEDAMTRHARRLGLVGFVFMSAVAVAAACSSSTSTSPHQPTPCPSYSGGLPTGDSLFGLYGLVSYCADTLPAYAPPVDTGHVTLKRATPTDSFLAVLGTQGQPPESISGTYTLPGPGNDSIHVTGVVKTPLGSLPVQLLGRFLVRRGTAHDTLLVSGQLSVGPGAQPISFIAARGP
jgi:hypothetical protein